MSYILDALKKSDRERQQRTPPSLNSVYSAEKQQPEGRRRIWPWLICLILLLNAGVLLCWMLLSRQELKTAAPPLESQAQESSVPTAPSVARKAAENVQAPSSREKEPPARNSLASNDGSQAANSAGEPLSATSRQNATENASAAPPSAPVPHGGASGLSRPKAASESPPRPESVQESSPPAAVAREKAPEKTDWKRTPDHAGAEAKRPAFGRTASPGPRKDVASAEGRTTPPGARTARSPATADRAGKAQSELEALVGKQVPFTGGKLPQADPPPAPPETKPAAPRASSPPPNVPEYEDLPPNTKGEIPFMSFSMFVYSDNPGNRLVGMKGRVVREGQELAPGLKVESIRPDGAILNYNGQRFYKRQF